MLWSKAVFLSYLCFLLQEREKIILYFFGSFIFFQSKD